jgi:uncharacterized Tic20 family protein
MTPESNENPEKREELIQEKREEPILTPSNDGESLPLEKLPEEPPPPPPETKEISKDEKTMAMLAHIGGIVGSFIVPLILWQIKKDESKYIADQAKEALNFQINLAVHALILGVITAVTCGFGAVLFIPWVPYAVAMPIIAGLKANNGEMYLYPATIRVIK